jgi:hypothetical protein
MLDFGIAIGQWQEAEHKASTGARYAAVGRNPSTTLSLPGYLADEEYDVCVRPGATTPAVGGSVTVTVRKTRQLTTILGLGPDLTLEGRAEMRVERLPSTSDGVVYGAAGGTCDA